MVYKHSRYEGMELLCVEWIGGEMDMNKMVKKLEKRSGHKMGWIVVPFAIQVDKIEI
jgi:hypothetical protein